MSLLLLLRTHLDTPTGAGARREIDVNAHAVIAVKQRETIMAQARVIVQAEDD